MGDYDREVLLAKYRISILVNLVLLVIILFYLMKLGQVGIPVEVVSYEKQDLAVKSLEDLTGESAKSEKTEGVLVIQKEDDGETGIIFYGKEPGMATTGGLDARELLLQLGSGSMNAYAGGGCSSTFVYRGRIYCVP